MKKIALISFFCSNNMGDILIGEQEKKLFEKYYNVKCIDFSSLAVCENSNKVIVNNCEENIYSKIKRIVTRFSIASYLKILFKIKKKCRTLFDQNDCDAVLLAGGNMIMDLTVFPIYTAKAYYILKEAKKQNKKTALMFVGVGPFKNKFQLRLVRKITALCDYISVRDAQSAKLLQSIAPGVNVVTSYDPVLSVEGKATKPTKTIGVSVFFGTDSRQFENIKNGYIQIVKKIKECLPEYKIILYSSELTDYSFVGQVYEEVKDDGIFVKEIKTPNELLDFYKEVDLVIASRMHSLITALVMRTPVIGFVWQEKVRGLAKEIDMEDRFFEITKLSDCGDLIFKKAISLLDNYDEEVKEIDKRVNKIHEEIKKSLDEFVAFI